MINLTPVTATIAIFVDIPQMLENGWEMVVYSDLEGKAVMVKPGAWKLDETTCLPEVLEPKKGEAGAGKPVDVDSLPVVPDSEL